MSTVSIHISKFCGHTLWHDEHHMFTISNTVFGCPGYTGVQLESGRQVGWMK